MSEEERLLAKLKKALSAKSVVEKEILSELNKVREIKDQRATVFDKLKIEESKLIHQLQSLNKDSRMPALLKGEVSSAANTQAVSNTVIVKLDLCRKNLETSYMELQRAKDREAEVEERLKDIRTEQKQIEKIIDNRNFLTKIAKEESDQVSIEEILYKGNRLKL